MIVDINDLLETYNPLSEDTKTNLESSDNVSLFDNVPLFDNETSSNNKTSPNNFIKEKCPITIALNKLALKTGSNDISLDNVAIIGGDEVVFDNADYYITLDTIEVARFEAKYSFAPKEEQEKAIRDISQRLFADILGGDLIDAYSALFSQVMVSSTNIIEQLAKIIILITVIAENLPAKNMTLRDLILVKNHQYVLPRRPDVLKYQLGELNSFLRKFPINLDTPQIPELTVPLFPANENICDSANSIEDIKKILEQKIKVLKYMTELEKYHIIAIKYMEEIINSLLKKLKELK
jgi:hypothetical protein